MDSKGEKIVLCGQAPVLASWCYCFLQDVAHTSTRRLSEVLKALKLNLVSISSDTHSYPASLCLGLPSYKMGTVVVTTSNGAK